VRVRAVVRVTALAPVQAQERAKVPAPEPAMEPEQVTE
jgi:hypothetical protein